MVALATARRVGELHALSKEVVFVDADMHFAFLPSFVAKTESASNPIPRHFEVNPSLIGRGGHD